MIKIIKSIFLVVAALFISVAATGSYFSDSESITNNTFASIGSNISAGSQCPSIPEDFCSGNEGNLKTILDPSTNCPTYTCENFTSDIIITEFMANPDGVNDNVGEWFEIYNTTSHPINIKGYKYRDKGVGDWNTIIGDFIVPPRGYRVLATSADPLLNGGISDAYYLASSFNLTNTKDEIILAKSAADGNFTIIDQISYDKNAGYTITAGKSNMLIDLASDNDLPASWGQSTVNYNATDKGTPGGPNA